MTDSQKHVIMDCDGVIFAFREIMLTKMTAKHPDLVFDQRDIFFGLTKKERPIRDAAKAEIFADEETLSTLPVFYRIREAVNEISEHHVVHFVTGIAPEYHRARESNLAGFTYRDLQCVGTQKFNTLRKMHRQGLMTHLVEDSPELIKRVHLDMPDVEIFYPRHSEYTSSARLMGMATPYFCSEQLKRLIV